MKLKEQMRLYLFIIVAFFISLSAVSQDGPKVVLDGKITDPGKKSIPGVTITLKKGSTVLTSVTTSSNGKIPTINIPMGEIYSIVVAKDGYVSKEIRLDFKTGYFPEDSPEIMPVDMPIDLILKKPDVDYTPISNGFVIGGMKIDPTTGAVAYDYKFSEAQKKKYDDFIKEIDGKANADEQKFKDLVAAADKAIAEKKFDVAVTNYEEAVKIKNDPAVVAKLADAKKKAEDFKKYNEKMVEAKKAYDSKDYGYAKKLYEEASVLQPTEPEPKAKITEITAIINAEMGKEQEYAKLIAEADKALMNEDFDVAITKYEAAIKLKPTEQHPKTELAKAKDLKAKKAADAANAAKAKADFDKFMASGDTKLGAKDFDNSIAEYKKALDLNVDNTAANAKIKAAQDAKTAFEKEKAEADAKAKAKQDFDAFIAAGNAKMTSKEYTEAISEYQKAKALNVDNTTADAKIKAAQDAKNAEDAANAKKVEFDKFIANGDSKLGSNDFDNAVAEYQKALATAVDNTTANAKIKAAQDAKKAYEKEQADKAAADAANAKRAEFDKFIADGDSKLGSNDFDNAVAEYQKALATAVDNTTANAKIKAAQDAKKAYEKEQADKSAADAANAKRAEFDKFIADGDSKLGSNDFDNAVAEYQKALATAVDNTTANAKIKAAQDAKKAYEKEQADKSAAEIAAQKRAEFDKFIADGDSKLGSNDFDNAIAEYQKALATGVDNPTATTKIKEANAAKIAYAKEQADKSAAEIAAQKRAEFDKFIADGDSKLGSNDFDDAIAEYNKALATGVDNPTATTKIKEATAAKAAYAKELTDKANSEANAKKAEFEGFINTGNDQVSNKQFDAAITEYTKALNLNFDNPTAQAKINAAKDAKLAHEKEVVNASKAEEFNNLIKQGDEATANKEWDKAKEFYTKANQVNPTDKTPQEKINNVNTLMAAETAGEQENLFNSIIAKAEELKTAQDYKKAKELLTKAKTNFPAKTGIVDQKIKEIDDIIAANAAKEKQYNDLLALADNSFESQKWEAAKENYIKAKAVFDREYPTNQIAIIDKNIEDAKNKANQNAELEAKKQQYNALMTKAKGEFDGKNYEAALTTYKEAKVLMPSETAPQLKIDEINKIIADLAKSSATEQAYKDAIKAADAARDAAFAAEDSDAAKTAKDLYSKANQIKSSETYPQSQVDLLNAKIKEWSDKEQDEAYMKIIAKADELLAEKKYEDAKKLYTRANTLKPSDEYPPKKLKEIEGLLAGADVEKKYLDAIKIADAARDAAIAAEDSDAAKGAKDLYSKANQIKSDEKYPQSQVDLLNAKIKEWSDKEQEAAYMKIIAKADELFNAQSWDDAEKLYTRANTLKPSDPYPPAQLNKIRENRGAAITTDKYNEFIKKGNAAFETENYIIALNAYQDALGIKENAVFPKNRIDEINALLKKKKEAEAKANNAVVANKPPDPFPYGEETTMSEEEMARYMQDGRINTNDDRAKAVNTVKENFSTTFDDEKSKSTSRTENSETYYHKIEAEKEVRDQESDNTRQTNVTKIADFQDKEFGKFEDKRVVEADRSNTIHETNQKMTSDRSVADVKADDRRQGVIANVEGYKDTEYERYEVKNVTEVDRSASIYENNQKMTSDRSVADIKADDRRQGVIANVEGYKDTEYERYEVKNVTEVDRSASIYENNQKMTSDRSVADIKADDRRQGVIANVEGYKDTEYERYEVKNVTEVDRSASIYENNQKMTSDRSVADIKADDRRQGVIANVEGYKDTEYERYEVKNVTEVDRSSSIYENNQKMTTDRSVADIKADERRERAIPEVEKYKNFQTNLEDNNQTKQEVATYSNYTAKEDMMDKYSKFANDADIPRQDNIKAVDIYKDKTLDQNKDIAANTINKNDQTSEKIAAVNTKQATLYTDEDKTREKNVSNVSDYKDTKLNAEGNNAASKNGKGYDVSQQIEAQKSVAPTAFSDANVDPLASTYPQGVTEKSFQRKNAKGEIIEFTILRIVVEGNKANEYKKVTTQWGVNYFKNGSAISQHIWDTETN